MKDLYFVTSNSHKVNEVEQILGQKVLRYKKELREIQSLDVKEVAEQKALDAFKYLKKPLFVEDSGLFIDALNGFPGALSKWANHFIGGEGLCRLVSDKTRSAEFKTCIAFHDGKKIHFFIGGEKGVIVDSPRGNGGFGLDPIFQPDGHNKTFAEMTLEQKNAISHRKQAFEKFRTFLGRNSITMNQ